MSLVEIFSTAVIDLTVKHKGQSILALSITQTYMCKQLQTAQSSLQ